MVSLNEIILPVGLAPADGGYAWKSRAHYARPPPSHARLQPTFSECSLRKFICHCFQGLRVPPSGETKEKTNTLFNRTHCCELQYIRLKGVMKKNINIRNLINQSQRPHPSTYSLSNLQKCSLKYTNSWHPKTEHNQFQSRNGPRT